MSHDKNKEWVNMTMNNGKRLIWLIAISVLLTFTLAGCIALGAASITYNAAPEDPSGEADRDSPENPADETDYELTANSVTVSTPQELADAIAPFTCITLNAGVYDLSTVVETANSYANAGSGKAGLIVSNIEGLTLQAASGANVELVTPDRFAEVLMFSFCNGIKLSGIEAGHTVTGEYECDAGVVFLDNSANIVIKDSLFYGCGAIGITFDNCVSAQIIDTTVTDCSLRAVDLRNSNEINFTGCSFIDNRAYGCVIFGYDSSAEFLDCMISGNKSLEWSTVEFMDDNDVLFERCVFQDNALLENALEGETPVFLGQGIRLRGCRIEKSNFSEYWSDGVTDLGGNKLY